MNLDTIDNIEFLQAVIATHPNGKIVGRTRLQKTIYILQRLGLHTSYEFDMHFYGPYSEELTDDAHFADEAGLISEEQSISGEGISYYTFSAKQESPMRDLGALRKQIEIIAKKTPVLLELAATYDAFISSGQDQATALASLRDKKGEKCARGADEQAIKFLEELGLNIHAA